MRFEICRPITQKCYAGFFFFLSLILNSLPEWDQTRSRTEFNIRVKHRADLFFFFLHSSDSLIEFGEWLELMMTERREASTRTLKFQLALVNYVK